jgi:lysophospholipase L1-like esterase
MDRAIDSSNSRRVAALTVLIGALAQFAPGAVPMKYNFSSTPIAGFQTITPTTPAYSAAQGYGFDFKTNTLVQYTPSKDGIEGKTAGKNPYNWTGDPFYYPLNNALFFSVAVPEGNYEVKLTLGSKDYNVQATIRAEQRRLMIEGWQIPAGQTAVRTFHVNRRSTTSATGGKISTTGREATYIDLDNMLTIEFNGNRPVIQQMEITPVDTSITVYLCGNSTLVDQPQEPWSTWGMNFPRFFKAGVSIADQAESGLASSSFIGEGRLNYVTSYLKPTDYVFVEFGHNDMKVYGAPQFKTYLLQFISAVKAKKANIVLVSPTARLSFSGTKAANTLGAFPDTMRAVAAENGIPFIDLNAMSSRFIEALGPSNASKAYTHFPANTVPGQTSALADNTHWNDYGGYELAKAMATQIKVQNFTFAKFLSDDYVAFDPSKPDPYATFQLPFSPFLGVFVKPDSLVTTRLAPALFGKESDHIASSSFHNGILSLRMAGAQDGLEARVVDLDGSLVASSLLHGQGETLIQAPHGFANRIHVIEIVRDGVIIDEQKVMP